MKFYSYFDIALFYIVVLLPCSCLPFLPFNGYEIRDLNSTGLCFTSQADAWSASNLRTDAITTVCGEDYLVGGFDILKYNTDHFYRYYNDLPTHRMIYFTMTVWATDSWDFYITPPGTGDTFHIDFDGTTLIGPYFATASFPKKTCGTLNWKDMGPIRIFGKVAHLTPTLTLRLLNIMDEAPTNEAFGFRDVRLLFVGTPDSGYAASTANSLCQRSPVTGLDKECGCPEGTFSEFTTACLPCNAACASCYGPRPNNCYQCAPGASFINSKCTFCHASCDLCSGPLATDCITCKTGLYLFDGMCLTECVAPAVATTDGCISYCSSPCTLAQFLDWNLVCQATCDFPLHQTTVSSIIKRCVYPCGTGEYLYWDGSCEKTCTPPLATLNVRGMRCNYPTCTGGQFLYWDGTCNTCNPPLVQSFYKGKQFCNYPCSPQEYLHYTGVCLPSCDPPFLVQPISTTKRYCIHPCPSPSYFINWDNTCQLSCLPPLISINTTFLTYCVPACRPDQYLLWNGTCVDTCSPPSTIKNVYYGNQCILPCPNPLDYYYEEDGTCSSTCDSYSVLQDNLFFKCLPGPVSQTDSLLVDLFLVIINATQKVSFLSVNKLLQPIKYLDITFPTRVQYLLKNPGKSIFSLNFGFSMSNSLLKDFTNHKLPLPFQNNGLHSSFLVNFWQNLTTLWIVLGIAILIFAIRKLSWKLQWIFIANVSKSLSYIPIWNFPLVLLFANIDSIVLFSALELQTFKADSVASVFSLIICLLFLVLMGCLLFGTFYSSTKYQNLKEAASTLPNKKNPETKIFRTKWSSIQVLFKGYKKGAFYGNLFYFFYTIRLIVPMAIATLSYISPMIQSLLYTLISLITVLYIAIVQPIKSLLNRTQLLVIEGIVMIMNLLVIILVSFDIADSVGNEASILIGDLILLGNLLVNFLLVVFLALKVLNGIKFALKLRLQNHPEEEAAWFALLFLPIQQGGMGFEQAKPLSTSSNEPTPLPVDPFKNAEYAKVNAEKPVNETTRFENSMRETYRSEQPTQFLQDINDEIVVFEEPEILTTTMHVHDLPRVTESSAFPIMKISDKNASFMN